MYPCLKVHMSECNITIRVTLFTGEESVVCAISNKKFFVGNNSIMHLGGG